MDVRFQTRVMGTGIPRRELKWEIPAKQAMNKILWITIPIVALAIICNCVPQKQHIDRPNLHPESDFFIDKDTPLGKAGYPTISDPTSELVVCPISAQNTGQGNIDYQAPLGSFLASKTRLKGDKEQPILNVSRFAVGIEPGEEIVSTFGSGEQAWIEWEQTNQLPTGIMRYVWMKSNQEIECRSFTFQNVYQQSYRTQSVNSLGISLAFNKGQISASVYQDDKTPIVILQTSAGLYLALGSDRASQWNISGIWQDPRYQYNCPDETLNGGYICIGLRTDDLALVQDEVNFFMAMGRSEESVVGLIKAALEEPHERYEKAYNYWTNYLLEIQEKLDKLSPTERYAAAVALNQIAANSIQGGYICAGAPSFLECYAKDNAWASIGLVHWKPELAKDALRWFPTSGKASICTSDAFDLNGNHFPGEHPTDWAAAYMYGASYVFNQTGDNSYAMAILPWLDDALAWVTDHFDRERGHIDVSIAHTHDSWDQYTKDPSEIIESEIQFEAEIDILWAIALEQASSVYAALGDKDKEHSTSEIAALLLANVDEFRTPEGGLYFGMKTDGTTFEDLVAMPPNLVSAFFLDDKQGYQYIIEHQSELGFESLDFPHAGRCSYRRGFPIQPAGWMSYNTMFAGIDKKWGSGECYAKLTPLTKLGYLPGSLYAQDGDFVVGPQIENQTWSYGLLLRIINDANFSQ